MNGKDQTPTLPYLGCVDDAYLVVLAGTHTPVATYLCVLPSSSITPEP